MKIVFSILILLIICSCEEDDNSNNDWENLDCDNLKAGIINMDSDIVNSEINKLVTDLEPVKTDSDYFGHKENLDLLIERLNTRCDNVSAELIFYAGIETNPPQSEILLTTDSLGTAIKRVVDISTPDDDILSCVRIHKYYDDEWGEKGTVSFINVEGGCWEIISDKSIDYEPTNLEEEYKEDGLRIRFEFETDKIQVSECQISELVIQITRIEKI